RCVVIAERCTHVERLGVPGAAAADLATAGGWACRVIRRRFRVVVSIIPIGGPFPDVAVDIVEAEGVRRIAADGGWQRVSFVGRKRALTRVVVRECFEEGGVGRVRDPNERFRVAARPVASRGRGAGRVFPFGLSGQPISLAFLATKPLAECDSVVPRYVDHWL